MGSGFNFFTNGIDVTPSTTGAWVDVDVSAYIPSGSTGVILKIVNTDASTTYRGEVRKKGSTDDKGLVVGATYNRYAFVGVDENRVFQAYIGHTNVKIYLYGYTDANVGFLTNAVDVSPTTAGVWEDKDVSSYIPSGATGVICINHHPTAATYYIGIRKNGSTDTFTQEATYGNRYVYQLCGVDDNRVFEVYFANSAQLGVDHIWLVGYTKPPVTFFTNAVSKALTTTGWQDIDVSDIVEATADGVIGFIKNSASAAEYYGDVRAKGSTDDHSANARLRRTECRAFAVKLDADKKFQGYIDNTAVDHYIIGYTKPAYFPLTYSGKYVITSTTPVTTTSATLVDDPEATKTFTLDSAKTVLVIYQANSVYGASMPDTGMQNAISVDGTDVAKSWDSGHYANHPVRNCVFWVGTLSAGDHTIKGRFASNTSGSTATISNRVLLIFILDGNEFYYIDDDRTAQALGTFMDDPYAQVTFVPSSSCKALIMYNCSNSGAYEAIDGKKAAININGTDYAQAEKSPEDEDFPDSVFTVHALSLSTSVTVKGRFANASGADVYVTVNRRQLAVLLFDNSALLDVVTEVAEVSTNSNALVDDAYATITRTTTDGRGLLVVAMGTKRHAVYSDVYGERYGIKIDGIDRTHSRGSEHDMSFSNSAATAYAQIIAPGSHTIKGRFSNNYGTSTAKISARQVVALWLSLPTAQTLSVVVSNEALDKTRGVSGETITYTATVQDSEGNPLPSSFKVSLKIDTTTLIQDQTLTSDVYDPETRTLTLKWTVPVMSTIHTVKLAWTEQTIDSLLYLSGESTGTQFEIITVPGAVTTEQFNIISITLIVCMNVIAIDTIMDILEEARRKK